jgi:hypothetical protein
MKKIFLNNAAVISLTICFIIGTSCKKEANAVQENKNPYFIRFKANGTEKKFTLPAAIAYHDSMNVVQKSYWFTGTSANQSGSESLLFSVWDLKKVQIGIYRDNEISFGVQFKALLSFQPVTGLSYHSGGMFNNLVSSGYTANTVITISELTDKVTKGSFSGTLYQVSSNGAPPLLSGALLITEGEFYLPVR